LAIFVISMGFSYGLSEYLGSKAGFRYRLRDAKLFYTFFAVEVIPAALIVLVTPNLAQVILDVMVFNSIALAMPLVLLIDLTRRRDVVGRYAIGGLRAVVLYILTALILGLGAYAIIGAL